MLFTAPRGTFDILPGAAAAWQDSARWQAVEAAMHAIARQYGYRELRPPVFESTELFARGVGATTDIVQKEMFTLAPRKEEAEGPGYALRPEFTAGMVRAYLENGLFNQPQPTKIYAIGPVFRAERPQKGRYRQFHQWDVEVFGAAGPEADAEVIHMGLALAQRLGLTGLVVDLNSIGCPECRPRYRDLLRAHFRPYLGDLCSDCQARFERNPLRLLDCKADAGHPAMRTAPVQVEHLCAACAAHLRALQAHLDALGVAYRMNPRIVRGLDYYTRTVFEVLHPKLGAQNTLWGGGRYDGLVEELGGKPTPGVGFAVGVERLLQVLLEEGVPLPGAPGLDVFVAALGDAARQRALALVYEFRGRGLSADLDLLGRSLKAQLKYAGKLGARHVAILGDQELERGVAALRDMAAGTQVEVPLAELAERLAKAVQQG